MVSYLRKVSCGWSVPIYANGIRSGHIPKAWKQVRVAFIPKAGKNSHVNAKDFRAISFSSFSLKMQERVTVVHIRGRAARDEHVCSKGTSVGTDLPTVVSWLEEAPLHNENAVRTFIG